MVFKIKDGQLNICYFSADEEKEENSDAAVPIVKQKTKKTKNKKKAHKEAKQINNDHENSSDIEIIEIKEKKSKSTQAIKKQRISNKNNLISSDSDEQAPIQSNEPPTVKKKPQRAAKTKAKTKISNKKTSSQRSTLESVKKTTNEPIEQLKQNTDKNILNHTPSFNRLRIEALIESTNKKTLKEVEPPVKRPITRANNGGKVKQAVEIFEQQMRTATKTTERISRVVTNTSMKVRSSIDKRNLQSSQSKQQAKRKSVKKVNAFVKAATTSSLNVTSTVKHNGGTIKTNLTDQTIHEENSEKPPTRNILSSAMVQQQYRVASVFRSTLKANGERKPSILTSNFLDKNTPSKLNVKVS